MKKLAFLLPIFVLTASLAFAKPPGKTISIEVIIGTRQPLPFEAQLMRGEESKHPNIAKSMHDIEDAMKHLQEAPDDFGGHKGQAETDLKQAWISLRKALYFRVWQDTH